MSSVYFESCESNGQIILSDRGNEYVPQEVNHRQTAEICLSMPSLSPNQEISQTAVVVLACQPVGICRLPLFFLHSTKSDNLISTGARDGLIVHREAERPPHFASCF